MYIALLLFFFFNDTATTEIYTLSLHDALPISHGRGPDGRRPRAHGRPRGPRREGRPDADARGRRPRPADADGAADGRGDRKSTRLNSSHANISYAVFCLKKKKKLSQQC